MSPSPRQDVEIRSGDADVAAWFYPAAGAPGRAPCVVMSHGFSLTRHDGLAAYAEALAAAGSHVLVFDPRHLGDSGGTPRQRFRIALQQEDWRAAVAHARGRPDVDPGRVGAWAYSFAGGLVADLLARGELPLRAAMLLCPMLDGYRRVRAAAPRDVLRILPHAVRDRLGRHVTVPVTAPPGELGAMTLPGEAAGFRATVPAGSPWRNQISVGVLLGLAGFRPARRAHRISCPLWLGRCVDDITVDAAAIDRTAARAPRAELHDFPGDHFAPFTGEGTDRVVAAQVAFWTAQV